jgi:xanthine dehydrogenase accessory factor
MKPNQPGRLSHWAKRQINHGQSAVLVTVTSTDGSAPRAPGTQLVATSDSFFGTIGGGALEAQALTAARALLLDNNALTTLTVSLGPDIGMCCGGRVSLTLTPLDNTALSALQSQEAAQSADQPTVWIFGAGHVGQAMSRALAPLPLHTKVVDSRQDWLARLPDAETALLSAIPEAEISNAKSGDAVIIMTHDHAQDFMITEAALTRADLAYVGMIGSISKRKALEAQLRRTNGPDTTRLTCPIGQTGPGLRSPEIIAALLAADLTQKLLTKATFA